ncbi:hypothetical protein [Arthrobacter sp. TB 26]|uniref:hypothetical protein n=1 Tax=Arthrobacter sp. TB 26 TaxID=494420 RepID=UPI0003F7DFCB|nr:hypothetical protein [Arthrobacter sp. TB 26]
MVKTETVAGLPAPAARDFLRRVRVTDFDEEWALSLLETIGATDPKSTLDSFEGARYIERADRSPRRVPLVDDDNPGQCPRHGQLRETTHPENRGSAGR